MCFFLCCAVRGMRGFQLCFTRSGRRPGACAVRLAPARPVLASGRTAQPAQAILSRRAARTHFTTGSVDQVRLAGRVRRARLRGEVQAALTVWAALRRGRAPGAKSARLATASCLSQLASGRETCPLPQEAGTDSPWEPSTRAVPAAPGAAYTPCETWGVVAGGAAVSIRHATYGRRERSAW